MLSSWSVPLSRGVVVLVIGLTKALVAGVGIGLKVETSQTITKGKNDEREVDSISPCVQCQSMMSNSL